MKAKSMCCSAWNPTFILSMLRSIVSIYARYPFDYIIGSVHQTRGVSIFNRKRWKGLSPKAADRLRRCHYYELIGQSAKSGMFQVLGHIDAMKGYYPAFSDIPSEEIIDETLSMIADSGVAIEINTSGKAEGCGRLVSV